MAEGKMFV